MRKHSAFIILKINLFIIITCLFWGNVLFAQQPQTTISDFVIFGGTNSVLPGQTAPSSPGYAVQLSSSSNIQGGAVGSYKLIKSTGSSTINSNVYSGGIIQLANSNIVGGKLSAANSATQSGTILSVGSSANINGNIDVKGNIVIGGGIVTGKVTHPSGTTYSGPAPAAGNITGTPTLPVLPVMPPIINFPAYPQLPDISTTQTITAGLYDDIKLSGNKTLTFNGTGVYVFDLIDNTGTNNLVFDFKNNATGTFKLYIHNNANLDKINVSMINGGSAGRIFTEVHGTGLGSPKYSFNIANGSSGGASTKWLGTVWAPYAAINIGSGSGSSSVTGALWSGTQVNIQSGVNIVYAPYSECNPPNANAGPDKALDFVNQTILTGTSTTSGVTFSWQAINGGVITSSVNTAAITVSAAGTYIFTVTSSAGCFTKDTVTVTGKIDNLIGSELSSVVQNFNPNAPPSPFFTIQHDSIMIDVIAKENQYANALAFLISNGVTNILSNGNSNFIITGLFPIAKLPLLNVRPDLIVYVRPYYAAFNNSGIVSSAGDISMRSNLVRDGYQLQGAGVKVGVISDSYSTILSATSNPITNTAAQDISNGDLPGPGNPNGNTIPVHVLKDYPFKSTDEGRAMLQIVHDVAPKAELYFRTGFISAGDFAKGITDLRDSGCNVIVDDITFITEPFLKDGVVAAAVDAVKATGTTYFSAAGNFANKSYENNFNPIAAPGGLPGSAHNFGGGDVFQNVTLSPGNYTIVLQWIDDIYSLGQTSAGGTKNDLDIYLTPNTNGTALFGFNRNNINGDPIEILPFTVTSTVNTNILITNNTVGSNPARFKYIVFQGNITINEFATGSSTLVGQANALGAIAIGAARYDKAAPFTGPLSVESFSSVGGTFVNNVQRNKPDLVAPDGVNTTVNMGVDYDNNQYSNFFGTSAAAPHAAAVAALIIEGKRKFLNQASTSPDEIRTILQTTATDMNTPGFDFASGFGFINADSAMRTFAKPDPSLIQLVVPSSATPGSAPFILTVTGSNLSPTSVVKFRDSTLATTFINTGEATAVVPAFNGNPAISVYTAPVSLSGLDGGSSDSLKFFTLVKKNITITADNKTKKYAQQIPALTATILVDGVPLQNTQLTLTDLGLSGMSLATQATANSNVGTYIINATRIFDHSNPVDVGFLELYNYTFNQGSITIEKLPVTVTAQNETVTYGQKIPDIRFTYKFDGTNIADSIGFLNSIQAVHQSQLAKDVLGKDVLGLVNGQAVTIVNGQAIPIVNGQAVTIVNGQAVTIVNGQAIPIVNGQAVTIVNGQAIPIVNNLTAPQVEGLSFLTSTTSLQNSRKIFNKKLVNGIYEIDSTNVVDITQESILDFNTNSAQTYMLSSVSQVSAKGLIDKESFANGQAVTIVNGQAVTIVNGQAVTIVNGQAVTIVNGQAVTIVNGQAIPIVNNQNKTAVVINESEIGQGQSQLKALNMITGIDVGNQFVIPGSLTNDNLQITNIAGVVTITPAPVTITPTAGQSKIFSTSDPIFTYTNNAALNASDFTGTLGRVNGNDAGTYAYTLGSLSAGSNYSLLLSAVAPVSSFVITSKLVTITPNSGQTKIFGSGDPVFTYTNNAALNVADFTGTLGRVNGNDVGTYAYTLGNLSAGSNYNLLLSSVLPVSTFAITPKSVIVTPNSGQNKIFGDQDPIFTYANNAGLNVTDFAGTLGRVSGSDVGTYAYTLGNLSAGLNYNLLLSAVSPVSTFAITSRPVTITPIAGQTKVYGSNDPVFTYTNNVGLAAGSFTGVLNRVSGNNVGNYAYTIGTLSAGNNYTLNLAVANTFTIVKASLQVQAVDKVIFKGDPLPVFTSTITGLKNGDNPTVTYTLSPACVGAAGVYSIIPLLSPFTNVANYTISYTNGKLYINPQGAGAKKLKPQLDCVEEIMNPLPGQFRYIAHYNCENTNATTVYVPIGSDNMLSSAGGAFNAVNQPVIFLPGKTYFNVPFDGVSLTWEIRTYESTHKTSVASNASSGSNKCSNSFVSNSSATSSSDDSATINTTATDFKILIKPAEVVKIETAVPVVKVETALPDVKIVTIVKQPTKDKGAIKFAGTINQPSAAVIPAIITLDKVRAYPNPVKGRTTVYISNEVVNKKEIALYDSYGKSYPVKLIGYSLKSSFEIDLSGLVGGMYFIRVKIKEGFKTIAIVKE